MVTSDGMDVIPLPNLVRFSFRWWIEKALAPTACACDVGSLIFRGIRNCLPENALGSYGLLGIEGCSGTNWLKRKRWIFLKAAQVKIRLLLLSRKSANPLSALEKTVLLLDLRAYMCLPHPRWQASGFRQKLARLLVTTSFPGLQTDWQLDLAMYRSGFVWPSISGDRETSPDISIDQPCLLQTSVLYKKQSHVN